MGWERPGNANAYLDWNFSGSLLGGIFGLLIGMLVLRLRAAYLALFTLGFSEILRATISAEIKITRGQAGIESPTFENGITLFGHEFSKTDKIPPYYVMFFCCLHVWLFWHGCQV